ncbi:MAG: MFS transporter, partial [bacterium]|nr:MFS transporter [bacterium]
NQEDIMLIFILLNIVAFIGTYTSSFLVRYFDSFRIYGFSILMWILVICGILLINTKTSFIITTSLGAIATGVTQAYGRAIFASMIALDKSSQIFSYESFFNKTSSVIGPLIFGFVSKEFDQRNALIIFLVFFIAAYIFLILARRSKIICENN